MLTLANRLRLAGSSFRQKNALMVTLAGAGTSNESAAMCCFDSSGNIITSGYLSPATEGYVAKLSTSGAVVWQRKITMTTRVFVRGMVVDSSDNIYITLDGCVSGTKNGAYLLKYNSSGALQWQRKITNGTAANITPSAPALDSSGNIYFAATNAATKLTGLVVKYSSGGTQQWQREFSHASNGCYGQGICIDASDNIFVVGRTTANEALIRKYSTAGTVSTEKTVTLSASTTMQIVDITLDATGNIYVGGLANSSGLKYFVAKLNSSYAQQWANYFTGAGAPATHYRLAINGGNLAAVGDRSLMLFDSSGSVVMGRTLYATVAGTGTLSSLVVTADSLLIAASVTRATSGFDMLTAQLPLAGTATGVYDWVTYEAQTLTPNALTLSIATTTGITDAAGAHTESAGDATDAAGALTATTLSKTA